MHRTAQNKLVIIFQRIGNFSNVFRNTYDAYIGPPINFPTSFLLFFLEINILFLEKLFILVKMLRRFRIWSTGNRNLVQFSVTKIKWNERIIVARFKLNSLLVQHFSIRGLLHSISRILRGIVIFKKDHD